MIRRLALFGLVLCVFAGSGSAQARSRPNLLFISIDTLRADHVSSYGYERPTTPSIDLIAQNGTRFARAKSVAPWTLPSFASMFTGRYPTRHGAGATGAIRDVGKESPRILAPSVPVMGELLQGAGYRTGAVTSNPYLLLGPLRGFDDPVCKAIRADRIGALSREWIVRNTKDKRHWALWVHFNDPHEPTIAGDAQLRQLGYGDDVIDHPDREALTRWGERGGESDLRNRPGLDDARDLVEAKVAYYDAALRQVDSEIGRILELLQRRKELRNTVVVIVSDHGEEFLDHAEIQARWKHDPRGIWGIGHGHTLFEEQLHVPLVMMGPGVGVGRVIDAQFPLIDLLPTLLPLLRVPVPSGLDGIDRTSWLSRPGRDPIPAAAEGTAYGPDWIAFSDGRYKLIADRLGHPQLLFDLENDPRERVDLTAQLDSIPRLSSLRDALLRWNERVLGDAPAPPAPGELTEEMREGLKSLGYVQ